MWSRAALRQCRSTTSHLNFASRTASLSSSSGSTVAGFQKQCISRHMPAPIRAQVARRWYASEPEKSAETDGKATEGAKPTEEDTTKKALEAKDREIIELKDKYLRSVADFRNLQERSRREQQGAKDFAIQKFARDLIESVDNLDLALSNVPADKLATPSGSGEDHYKELRELHNGLHMTSTVLLNTLAKHGMERFDPSVKAEKFDPNLHEATFQAPQPDKEDGTVFHTVQKGFKLNGRVIRAPKVGVVKNS